MANKNKAEEYYRLQHYLESIKYAKQWLLEIKGAGDRKEERAACKIIAWSYYYLSNYQESMKYGTEELRIAQEEGDEAAESEAYEVLSKSYREANKSSLGGLDGSASDSTYTASAGKDQDSRFAPHHSPTQSEFPENGSDERTLQPDEIKQDDEIQEHVVMEEPLSSGVSPGLSTDQFASELPVKESTEHTYDAVSESKDAMDGPEHAGIKERPVSSDSSVPSEIKARGPEAKRAYENALKNGKVKVNRGRIMFIGQDRAGKTSLKKNLLGLPFDPQEQSTDGIEVDPSQFEYDIDQVKNWKRTDGKLGVSHFVDDLANMVAGKLKEEET